MGAFLTSVSKYLFQISVESKRARCSLISFSLNPEMVHLFIFKLRTGGQEYVFFNTFVDLLGYRRSPARRISDSKFDSIKLRRLDIAPLLSTLCIAVFAYTFVNDVFLWEISGSLNKERLVSFLFLRCGTDFSESLSLEACSICFRTANAPAFSFALFELL